MSDRIMHWMEQAVAGLRIRLVWVLGAMMFATSAHTQTLFARPDTTVNYASYQHIEECMALVWRVSDALFTMKYGMWFDTATVAQAKQWQQETGLKNWYLQDPRADSAVQAGKTCLRRFNADTVTFSSIEYGTAVLEGLLLVKRDQDAERFANRLLDSMRLWSVRDHKDALYKDSLYKYALYKVLRTYIFTGPSRFSAAKQYYSRLLAAVKGDSLYRTIDADLLFGVAALAAEDTVLQRELKLHALAANDSTPVEERMGSPGAVNRLGTLRNYQYELTEHEALDSLARSTLAYNLYLANTVVRRVEGGDVVTATDDRVKPFKVPDLIGPHWYTTAPGPEREGLVPYTKHGAVPPGTFPVKGKVNYIRSWPNFCHQESGKRFPDYQIIADCGIVMGNHYRKWKEVNPDIEIIILTNTYGVVGPMLIPQPADEADTLAKLFLGRHRMPGHLVVEETPFFHVDDPDGRRVDLPTQQMELMGDVRKYYAIKWWTDKEGYRVEIFDSPLGDSFKRKYKVLMDRPSPSPGPAAKQ